MDLYLYVNDLKEKRWRKLEKHECNTFSYYIDNQIFLLLANGSIRRNELHFNCVFYIHKQQASRLWNLVCVAWAQTVSRICFQGKSAFSLYYVHPCTIILFSFDPKCFLNYVEVNNIVAQTIIRAFYINNWII